MSTWVTVRTTTTQTNRQMFKTPEKFILVKMEMVGWAFVTMKMEMGGWALVTMKIEMDVCNDESWRWVCGRTKTKRNTQSVKISTYF